MTGRGLSLGRWGDDPGRAGSTPLRPQVLNCMQVPRRGTFRPALCMQPGSIPLLPGTFLIQMVLRRDQLGGDAAQDDTQGFKRRSGGLLRHEKDDRSGYVRMYGKVFREQGKACRG